LSSQPINLDWDSIDTVLLDMDGTLLDLHFDYYFWTQHLPEIYNQIQSGDIEKTTLYIANRLAEKQGQLEWYCTDYWSRQFDLNIIQAQSEVKHLIQERPQVIGFLDSLGKHQKNRVLITNSDRPSIELKFANSAIEPLLDQVISSHDYKAAKEDQQFWQQLQNNLDFDPNTTLFIDDSEPVLNAAHQFGIKHLLSIKQPISSQPREDCSQYPMIDDFSTLTGAQTHG
jgi:HAD superfamily hydrolase (TIGR01509 family)